jgi:hypothetical protein
VPVTWAINEEGVVVATVATPYSFDDWRFAADEILASVTVRPLRVLSHRRAADVMSVELVDHIIGYLRTHREQLAGSVAAIVISTEVSLGMARMLEIRAELARAPMQMKIFLNEADALQWLRSVAPVQT